jgi:hypothetical protein
MTGCTVLTSLERVLILGIRIGDVEIPQLRDSIKVSRIKNWRMVLLYHISKRTAA